MLWRTSGSAARLAMSVGLGLGLGGLVHAQTVYTLPNGPVPAPGAPAAQGDLASLADRMDDQVRALAEEIASDLGQVPGARNLQLDAQELAQAAVEFQATIRDRRDPVQVRQAYAGIDTTWHHLRDQLSRPGVASPAVDRAARRVDQLDAQMHQILGIGQFAAHQPLTGLDEARRLADALDQRAAALAMACRTDMMSQPGGNRLIREVRDLTQATESLEAALSAPNARVDVLADQFRPIQEITQRLEVTFSTIEETPRVQAAWQSLTPVVGLLRQTCAPQGPPVVGFPGVGGPPPVAGPAQVIVPVPERRVVMRPVPAPTEVVNLAGVLVKQASDFLQVFSVTSPKAPERAQFMADADRLRQAAAAFQQSAAQGMSAAELAFQFRDVDACYQRLARRTARIAQGRVGPNINQVQLIGQTCAQIANFLAVPSSFPVDGAPYGAPGGEIFDPR